MFHSSSRIMRAAFPALAAVIGFAGVAATADAQLTPRKVVAVMNGTQNFSDSKRAIDIFDVTDIGSTGTFNDSPLFSIWVGGEGADAGFTPNFEDFEDTSSLAVNPYNGTLYQMSFDSTGGGPAGTVAAATGDTNGDYDLHRIDYQEILQFHEANLGNVVNGVNIQNGVMYAPKNASYVGNGTAFDDGVDTDHPDNAGNTVFLDGLDSSFANPAIQKVGEVARLDGSGFFDGQDLEFVDAENLVLIENDNAFATGSSGDINDDHALRRLQRVNAAPGFASGSGFGVGGFNAQTTESWESSVLGLLAMDNPATPYPGVLSAPEGMDLIIENGRVFVAVHESDGGSTTSGDADDVSIFEIDFATNTSTKLELRNESDTAAAAPFPTGIAIDNDPEFDPAAQNGSTDAVYFDVDGNLIVVESGAFDIVMGGTVGDPADGATEPKVLRRNVKDLTGGGDLDSSGVDEVVLADAFGSGPGAAWDDAAFNNEDPAAGAFDALSPSVDDDGFVTSSLHTVYDKGNNWLYIFDALNEPTGGLDTDVYVLDLDTGSLVHEELDALESFVLENDIRLFLRGDVNNDGVITPSDIDDLFDLTGGTALERETFDLTGDGDTTSADADELVLEILGTEFGDTNLDGNVNISDLTTLAGNFGGGTGWTSGDVNGDGVVNITDLTTLSGNFGFTAPVPVTAIPEPTTVALLGLGGLALLRRRR